MIRSRNIKWAGIIAFITVMFLSCRKRDAMLPDNLVVFEAATQGITDAETSIDFKIKLTRNTDRDIPLVIKLINNGLVYATDYTTAPASNASGEIHTVIPSGNNEAKVTVSKVPGALFDGDESIVFEIHSSGSPVFIGNTKLFTLNFAELIADNAAAKIDGGGALFPNKVFVDISANRQAAVLRTTWDLGFYTGADDFRVILNSSTAMMAKQINKNDLNAVTANDTIGFNDELSFNLTTAGMAYIDHPLGDLTKTAIAEVSATPDENKVYIINRGQGVGTPAPLRGWKKVRIIRNGSGYTLQHADINATSFTTVGIAKDDQHFFKYVSFETGQVTVEPAKTKWDFAWTYFTNTTNFGGGEIPYLFQDVILINRNVQVARVMEATKAYAAFNEASLQDASLGLDWKTTQTVIGSDWRAGGGPGMEPSVRTDRYYVIRDGDDNYYKLKFTALTENRVRGYPFFEAVLVKKGN